MGLISTVPASCRDCYKCVRSCPVKAIKVINGHAEVIEGRCISDGRCVRVCPQNAKKVENNIDQVKNILKIGTKTAVSLAPSFTGAFPENKPGQVVAGLKKLGFSYIGETAAGAKLVAEEHKRLLTKTQVPVITSCCPVVVNLIEIYYPELIPYLAPIVSPMVAHAKMLKQIYGSETKVVFIGPCIAKKGEFQGRSEVEAVDAVLTFQEVLKMLEEQNIKLSGCQPVDFDNPGPANSRTFPLPGGLARSVTLSTDLLAKEIISVDGLDEVIDFLERFHEVQDLFRLIELLACQGGCITGPDITGTATQFARRATVIAHAETFDKESAEKSMSKLSKKEISNLYFPRGVNRFRPTEEQIRDILAKTGKFKPEDELNCGACGYDSCRDKATAVAMGMAEVDMCIPYMRDRAESKANLICQMTPNAILVVTNDLKILELNPAAERKFSCFRNLVIGKNLTTIMDPRYFEEALYTKKLVTGEINFPGYKLVAWQSIFYVEKDEILIGIYSDITQEKKQREQLSRVTDETLEKAQEVINKQMKVAQEIAGLLGETTAETKVLLTKLMNLIRNEDNQSN